MRAAGRLILSAVLGLGFFVIPVPYGGKWTVLFDVVVKAVTQGIPNGVALYAFGLIVVGGCMSVAQMARPGRRETGSGATSRCQPCRRHDGVDYVIM